MLKRQLKDYNFSEEIKEFVLPFEKLVEKKDEKEVKKLLAHLTLEILDKIKNKKISSEKANSIYLLLDLYINDNLPDLDKDENVYSILFEGNILHDLGQPYGADLKLMEDLTKKLLKDR